jgi:hypothetical protein
VQERLSGKGKLNSIKESLESGNTINAYVYQAARLRRLRQSSLITLRNDNFMNQLNQMGQITQLVRFQLVWVGEINHTSSRLFDLPDGIIVYAGDYV